jgi:GGDEF domain-containing protein
MRASDVAGMLTEGEIGLLMHDMANEQAKAIAERLRNAVNGAPGRETILIGVASWTPGQDPADGIVRRARADALADGRRAQVSVSPRGVNS